MSKVSKNQNDFLVVLPVLNEKEAIEKMILSIKKEEYPLIITDGGSTDGSIEIAERHQIEILHRPGKGKGYGLNMALNDALEKGYKYIVYMDCDMTYPVHQIRNLLEYRYQYDMIVGNRNRENMTTKSKTLNTLITYILNFLFKIKLKDPASGFRVLNVNVFIDKIQEMGLAVEFDLLRIAYRNQLSIKEVKTDYYTRIGDSKLTVFELFKVIFTILKVRFFLK
ncbi:MAG: glycosyltransferase family 2 protein [Chitinophagales bacterium]|nr:glycosyltransferase family 2 protein [Chitinophagales bacterium]